MSTPSHPDKIMLTYALNQEGKLVHVDSVPNGNDCGCFCPYCKEKLQAKNKGTVKQHHFAHRPGSECSHAYESMLHLLAKQMVQEAFYSDETLLNIRVIHRSFCNKFKRCKYVRMVDCCRTDEKLIDLKKWYDKCEQEISYDNVRRRSDLKFYSTKNPSRRPLYIEFFVSHKSDDIKLHSGNLIIEVNLNFADDIESIVKNGFEEKSVTKIVEGIEYTSSIEFFGFNTVDYENDSIERNVRFSRYVVSDWGRTYWHHEMALCNHIQRESEHSLYEVCFHTQDCDEAFRLAKWMAYHRVGAKSCYLCSRYKRKYYGGIDFDMRDCHSYVPELGGFMASDGGDQAQNCKEFQLIPYTLERYIALLADPNMCEFQEFY